MNTDIENAIASRGRLGMSAKKGLGGIKESIAQENAVKNIGKEASLGFPANLGNRRKFGKLNSNVAAGTPLRKGASGEEKELVKQCAGDDLDLYVKSTSSSAQKTAKPVDYPPVEYGYTTNLEKDFENDIMFPESQCPTIWERDEEVEERRCTKEISEEELEALLDWI